MSLSRLVAGRAPTRVSADRAIVERAEILIDRPPEEVFDFLADARNEPSWIPEAPRVELLSAPPIGRGARFRGHYRWVGASLVELAEFARPRRVTFRAAARLARFDDAVTLTPVPGGTRLRATMTFRPRGPLWVLAPLIRPILAAIFRRNWVRLKLRLEHPAALAAGAGRGARGLSRWLARAEPREDAGRGG
jgi:uncharacterized protein YndB with AHSA1/START domain